MQVYTQIVRPQELDEDDLWIPCLTTATVKHSPAEKQPLIVTHIEAINHYEHSLTKLLEQKVFAVGSKTYDRLVEAGFATDNIHWRHRADELKLRAKNIGPMTWLHGDKYARDFGKVQFVDDVQTYESRPDKDAVKQVLKMDPDEIYVYSDAVLKELEVRNWSHTKLKCANSCTPDKTLWLDCVTFDPNV